MTLDEAFALIENLDYAEGLKRKFAPNHSLIQVNRDGEVVSVERFKDPPTDKEQMAALNRHPGSIQISGNPGTYGSVDALRQRVEKSMWLFERMKK